MLLEPGRITFSLLQERILDVLRRRVSNGDFTERGLARAIGISQPHIHNVLKGVRALTPDLGDLLMTNLDISLTELLSVEELGEALLDRQVRRLGSFPVPVLAGRLGPSDPFPSWRNLSEWVVAKDPELRDLRRPAFVQLGADPVTPPDWSRRGFGLLDFDEASRMEPVEPGWYALRWRGAGYLRQVRVRARELAVLGQTTWAEPGLPEVIPLTPGSVLQVVRARLAWVGSDPMPLDWLAQSGLWLPRAARS